MKSIDPGHSYTLLVLDNKTGEESPLRFVKREGPNYPGNVGHYSGTTLQECWRATIDRLKYVDIQIHDDSNYLAIFHLRECIKLLEERAARRHRRPIPRFWTNVEAMPTCQKCGHIGCREEAHEKRS